MRIRTDIKIHRSIIRLSSRIARLLNCRSGQVLTLHRTDDEVYLGVTDNPDGVFCGRLYKTHGGFRCSNRALVKSLTDESRCEYRCGEAVTINGKNYITIITARNYANRQD